MPKKNNNPIIIFNKKKEHDKRIEGGGSDLSDAYLLKGDALLSHVSTLTSQLEEVQSALRESEDDLPIVASVKIHKKALSKTHKRNMYNVFNVDARNVLAFDKADLLQVKFDNEDALKTTIAKINDTNNTAHASSAILEVVVRRPICNLDVETFTSGILKIVLLHYGDRAIQDKAEEAFEQLCLSNSLNFKREDYSIDAVVYTIPDATSDTLELLSDSKAIDSISLLGEIEVNIIKEEHEKVIKPISPDKSISYPTLGIMDSGIESNNHFKDWIVAEDTIGYAEDDLDKDHGTHTAFQAIYGDIAEEFNYVGESGCNLVSAVVLPKDKTFEVDLMDNIREAINKFPDVKIWNLSVGSEDDIDTNRFSEFGMFLDEMQRSKNILFIKTAGNCKNFEINIPSKKITKSADSVCSLVVGGAYLEQKDGELMHHRSAFSRIGHGPHSIIKPEVTCYGGKIPTIEKDDEEKIGVLALTADGLVTKTFGTSFAAPRVATIAAYLNHYIDEEFNPLFIKSLIIHNSSYHTCSLLKEDRLKELGYGFVTNIQETLYSSPYEVNLIEKGTLCKGDFFTIRNFPFPSNLIDDDGNFTGEITITLATDPVLDVNQKLEYIQSDIKLTFGTYKGIEQRDITRPHILYPIKELNKVNFLSNELYSVRETTSRDCCKKTQLISQEPIWQPIKKMKIDLSSFTAGNKKYLKSDRNWFLELRPRFKEEAEYQLETNGVALEIPYVVIVTISDPTNTIEIYDQVCTQLDENQFIYKQVKISEEISIVNEVTSN